VCSAHDRTTTLRCVALSGALTLLLALLLLPSAASAARGHVFKEAFGVPCTTATCLPGELKEPSAVAVDEATGEVYVLDQGNSRIQVFDGETGAFIRQFDGSGTPALSFEFGAAPQVSGIAVDNSCSLQTPSLTGPACETFDPSNEDVYVVDARHKVVDKFEADGTYVGQIKEADGSDFNELGGAAVESSGDLVVYQRDAEGQGSVYFFGNQEPNLFTGGFGPIANRPGFFAPGVSVDGAGNLYLRGHLTGAGERFVVEKYDHAGQLLIERLGTEDSSGVVADQKTNRSFVDNIITLAAFSPTGSELERLGEEAGAHHLIEGAGLAADAADENLYVADAAGGQVVVFEAQQPSPPEIIGEGVLDISSEGATFEAELNPRSEVGEAPTTYTFEYGPCTGGILICTGSPFTSATPAGALAAGFEIQRVVAAVTGLRPNTAYHFRLSAENAQSTAPTLGPGKTFTTQAAGAALTLPDFRAWELVSPADKEGASIEPISETGVVQAADDGQAITYVANAATEPQPQGTGASGGVQVLSTRGSGGWASQSLATPHQTATGVPVGYGNEYRAFSEDLEFGFVNPFGAFEPAISPAATEGTALRRTDYLGGDPAHQCIGTTMDCYQPLVTGASGIDNVPPGAPFGRDCQQSNGAPCGPQFQSATPDGDHVVLSSNVALTTTPIPPPSEGGAALYEWTADAVPDQQLQLVSVAPGPGEHPIEYPSLGFFGLNMRNAISADGTRVVFSEVEKGQRTGPVPGLFMRDVDKQETIQLDAAEPGCETCESGEAHFQTANADGSRVFFTDTRHLTADAVANPVALAPDLYECRIVEGPSGQLSCDLTDLTPETGGEGADVLGTVIGASEDGSYVYFVANGVLTSAPDSDGEQARPGRCRSDSVPGASCNLYLVHEGHTTLVSELSGSDAHDWFGFLSGIPARVSPDGEWLAFMSQASLIGGYDNRDVTTGKPSAEVYLYSAASGRLVCASCDPTGARPHGRDYLQLRTPNGIAAGPYSWFDGAWVAANLPGWTGNEDEGKINRHQPRYLSDSGRLFFNTVNALVPQDSNGTQDVYEYEPPNTVADAPPNDTCTTSSPTYGEASEGCVSLISSGSSSQESAFLDASEDGNDVFFLTSAPLTKKDIDTARDVYDARVGGGEAEVTETLACSGDACQQTSLPPGEANPGSLEFQGPGNAVQCRKGQVKKAGKCAKKQQPKKHKKKGHKKNGKKRKSGAKKARRDPKSASSREKVVIVGHKDGKREEVVIGGPKGAIGHVSATRGPDGAIGHVSVTGG
jgi:DNA-binding beta-propeller fold protein YncE